MVLGHSTSASGAWTTRSCSLGTMRDSRIVIACESLPPDELIATRAPARINFRYSRGMGMAVSDMASAMSGWCVGDEARGASLGSARPVPPPRGSTSFRQGGFLWLVPVDRQRHAGARAKENRYSDERRSGLAPVQVANGLTGSSIRGAELRITFRSSGDRPDALGPRRWSNGIHRHPTPRRR